MTTAAALNLPASQLIPRDPCVETSRTSGRSGMDSPDEIPGSPSSELTEKELSPSMEENDSDAPTTKNTNTNTNTNGRAKGTAKTNGKPVNPGRELGLGVNRPIKITVVSDIVSPRPPSYFRLLCFHHLHLLQFYFFDFLFLIILFSSF